MSRIGSFDLVKICYLYYKEGKTQEEISTAYGLSRFKVGRLLKQAQENGLVTVQINAPEEGLAELEVRAAKKFGLHQVVAVGAHEGGSDPARIGAAGARYLARVVPRCSVLGVAWGRSVSHLVENVGRGDFKHLTVVQITGGMGSIEGTDANALTMAMGRRLGASAVVIQAPAIVRNRAIRDTLVKEKQIRDAMVLAKKADSAIFGIGLPGEDGLLTRAGLLTRKTAASLEKAGAVGAICSRFFDPEGGRCPTGLDDRIVGLTLEDIRRIPQKICIAFGPQKVGAIRGALKGRFLDVLITDETTASALLDSDTI